MTEFNQCLKKTQVIFSLWMPSVKNMIKSCLVLSVFLQIAGILDKYKHFCTSEFKLLISLSHIFEQAARQSQITPDSYHEKHRDHPDDGKSYGLG